MGDPLIIEQVRIGVEQAEAEGYMSEIGENDEPLYPVLEVTEGVTVAVLYAVVRGDQRWGRMFVSHAAAEVAGESLATWHGDGWV